MGIFDAIKSAIWGGSKAADAPAQGATLASATPGQAFAASAPQAPTTPAPQAPAAAAPAASPSAPVDVASILDAAVKQKGQTLDWRHSIVDLMKALNLDSSLAHRKQLAQELNYTGDMNDSATMNMWLHRALMNKLAENGGRVPPELLS